MHKVIDVEDLLDRLVYQKYNGMRKLPVYEEPFPERVLRFVDVIRHAASCDTCRNWAVNCTVEARSNRNPRQNLKGICPKGIPLWQAWIAAL